LVQDYRKLNQVTIKNKMPLPLIGEVIDKLKEAKYFNKLDLIWGYNNVQIKEGDEWKAAFLTNKGLFEPQVMYFGLCNSLGTFQRMMNSIFRELLHEGVLANYMDNFVILARTMEELEEQTIRFLKIAEKHNLCFKRSKCNFNMEEIPILGVVVGKGQVKIEQEKIKAVKEWKTPTVRHGSHWGGSLQDGLGDERTCGAILASAYVLRRLSATWSQLQMKERKSKWK